MSSSSSSLKAIADNSSTLQQPLQFLLQTLPEWWVYSIFWQASEDDSGRIILVWADGHFRGASKTDNQYRSNPKFTSNVERENDDGKEFQTLLNRQMDKSKRLVEGDATDSEWFYTVSLTRSFASGDGVLGRSYSTCSCLWLTSEMHLLECDRVKEARQHGIQTMVCVSTPSGVLELGSVDIISYDWVLVSQIKSLFGLKLQQVHEPQVEIPESAAPFLDAGIFPVAQNEINDRKLKEVQEKKEPSEYRLLFPESRPSISDGNFTTEPPDNALLKKRGRRPKFEKDTSSIHVEAERQRREKLNRRFCVLRSVVPNVSKMDKASLLADAITYIAKLKARIDELEAKSNLAPSDKANIGSITKLHDIQCNATANTIDHMKSSPYYGADSKTIYAHVMVLGSEAMITVHSRNVDYPAARLMVALRSLDMHVLHASVSNIKEMVLQDVVVRIPDNELANEEVMKSFILKRMMSSLDILPKKRKRKVIPRIL